MTERALCVIVITEKQKKDGWKKQGTEQEFNMLVRSARIKVEENITCNLRTTHSRYLLGLGKVEEIGILVQELKINSVIFSENLSSKQQKNIEKIINVKTIDRTQLILDIFARRAHTNEGKLQVELAQLEYMLPRLTGKGVVLSRLGGGIGTRGPGEQKLEVDRRRIRIRINRLKKEIKAIAMQRRMRRKKREQFSIPTAALIGYTNAGKSTLLNRLTGSEIYVDNMLFATLDPTIRKLTMSNGQSLLFVDTVGFLYNLPHGLVEAFKATLEEALEADILLHILDASNPRIEEQMQATYDVLSRLGVKEKPVITILNKIDKIEDTDLRHRLIDRHKDAIMLSALSGENMDELITRLIQHMAGFVTTLKLNIPRHEMKLLHLICKHGKVIKRIDKESGIYIEALVPESLKTRLKP